MTTALTHNDISSKLLAIGRLSASRVLSPTLPFPRFLGQIIQILPGLHTRFYHCFDPWPGSYITMWFSCEPCFLLLCLCKDLQRFLQKFSGGLRHGLRVRGLRC